MREILNQRKALFQSEKEALRKQYINICRQISNLSPDSPSYTKLLRQKEQLTVKMYSKESEFENRIAYLQKRVEELGEEEEEKKGLFDKYIQGFKDTVEDIKDNSKIYKMLDFSSRVLYGSAKMSLKGAGFVAKTGLNALLTKKEGGRRRFGITFGGKRVGRYRFNDNFLRKYSSDYQKLYNDFYMLGKNFYNRNIKKGKIDANDVINYLRDQGKSSEEIREQMSLLMEQGFKVSKTIKQVLFPEPTPNDNFEDEGEFEDIYDSVSVQNRAIQLDEINKDSLRETLYEFYDYMDRKGASKKKKSGGGATKLIGTIFGLIKKLGIAIVGIATFLGPVGVIFLIGAAVAAFSYFWSDIKTFFLKKIDDIFNTSFSKDSKEAFPTAAQLNYDYYGGYGTPIETDNQTKMFKFDDDASSLGQLSSRYEGRADTVSNGIGDKGGISFGKYQFASKTGGLHSFMSELKDMNPEYYNKLMENGAEYYRNRNANKQFQENWKKLAREDSGFAKIQDEIAKKKWFDPAAEKFKNITGVDVNESKALSNALWSASIQHGGIEDIIKNSGIEKGQTTEEMIDRLYNSRANYVAGLNISNKGNIFNRYSKEKRDAYLMAQQEMVHKKNLGSPKNVPSEVMIANNNIIEEEEKKIALEMQNQKRQNQLAQTSKTNTDKIPAPIKIASHLGGSGLDVLNTGVRV